MKVLVDTNIVIHRETPKPMNQHIGMLFKWLDKKGCSVWIHPVTVSEIESYHDSETVNSFKIKMDSYNIAQTVAPPHEVYLSELVPNERSNNDRNDNVLLNELLQGRYDILITEDRGIHTRSMQVGISHRVYSIQTFIEYAVASSPAFVERRVPILEKILVGHLDYDDPFFDSLKEDYPAFSEWLNRKAEEPAYVLKVSGELRAFLYLKIEGISENYHDITPQFQQRKRLKIGTLKVALSGFRIGERMLKIIFDNAIQNKVDEVYVTLVNNSEDKKHLIQLLTDYGFRCWGAKQSGDIAETVFVRSMQPIFIESNVRATYPFFSARQPCFLVPIRPEYHTSLLPDSILNNEDASRYSDPAPHRNAISKQYISRSIERNIPIGSTILFYRTGGRHKGVLTTVGVVESVVRQFSGYDDFVSNTRKRTVLSDDELHTMWHDKPNLRPFIVNFLDCYSLPNRPNLQRLIEHGVIESVEHVPRGFTQISQSQLQTVLELSNANQHLIVNSA